MPRRTPKIIDRKLGRERAWGLYDDTPEPTIELDPRMESRHRLHILLHEILHHCEGILGAMDHEELDKAARVASAVLWRDGWRRTR